MNPLLKNAPVNQLKQMMSSFNSPDSFLSFMETKNPQFVRQFRDFQSRNQGKSVEQIAQENNIDLSMFKNLF
jgi:hypothetical protein